MSDPKKNLKLYGLILVIMSTAALLSAHVYQGAAGGDLHDRGVAREVRDPDAADAQRCAQSARRSERNPPPSTRCAICGRARPKPSRSTSFRSLVRGLGPLAARSRAAS
jgi:hypothetical protein